MTSPCQPRPEKHSIGIGRSDVLQKKRYKNKKVTFLSLPPFYAILVVASLLYKTSLRLFRQDLQAILLQVFNAIISDHKVINNDTKSSISTQYNAWFYVISEHSMGCDFLMKITSPVTFKISFCILCFLWVVINRKIWHYSLDKKNWTEAQTRRTNFSWRILRALRILC